ncbi:MAG: hypothetical protein WC683_06860 [bacterium]
MMEYKTVTTQAELEAAVTAGFGVRVDATWRASAHVVAWASAHVVARGSAYVEAWGSAHVEAWDSAHVVARGSAHVEARDSAHVEARDSAHVEAWDSAHVVAREFSSVTHFGASVVIKLLGKARTTVVKYPASVSVWAKLKGLAIVRGHMTLWKSTRPDGTDFKTGKCQYGTGIVTVAPEWDAQYKDECGKGLHLADSPSAARLFVPEAYRETFRLFRVSAAVKDCRCFPGLPNYPMKLRSLACKGIAEVPRDYIEGESDGNA